MEESSKHAAFVLLVNLSIWRIASPVVGFYVLGYPGIIIGVDVSFVGPISKLVIGENGTIGV
jgi:hypothetical protein